MTTMRTTTATKAKDNLIPQPHTSHRSEPVNEWTSEAPGPGWEPVSASVVQHGEKLTVYHTYQLVEVEDCNNQSSAQ